MEIAASISLAPMTARGAPASTRFFFVSCCLAALLVKVSSLCCTTNSNNGACLTMYEIGQLRYNEEKELDPVTYTTPWDAQYGAVSGGSLLSELG
jgi:hypothetical protein